MPINKLKALSIRAKKLRYYDTNELDDIIQKTKMLMGILFPIKFTYTSEIDSIKFSPTFYVTGQPQSIDFKKWIEGQQTLINFINTRIEEWELQQNKSNVNKPEYIVTEKIVKVKDDQRIKELELEIQKFKAKRKRMKIATWGSIITVGLAVIGGTFIFGKYFGENKFDQVKINLSNQNKELKDSIVIYQNRVENLKDSLNIFIGP
jgi:hypothetical protein